MRHSKTEKAKTHERIVAIAAKKFREQGLAGIGIADLMKAAGLTVGGFYKHFKSRDALVAEAVGSALEMWKERIDAASAAGPRWFMPASPSRSQATDNRRPPHAR